MTATLQRVNVQVPGRVSPNGTLVPAHTKLVDAPPAGVSVAAIANGTGGDYWMRTACAKLAGSPHWEALLPDAQAAHVLSLAADLKHRAAATSALAEWRRAARARVNPSARAWQAWADLPPEERNRMVCDVVDQGGTTRYLRPPKAVPRRDLDAYVAETLHLPRFAPPGVRPPTPVATDPDVRSSSSTTRAIWRDLATGVTFPRGALLPEGLNGVPFTPWRDAPTTPEAWAAVAGVAEVEDPPLMVAPGTAVSVGMVVLEEDGRAWVAVLPDGSTVFPVGPVDPRVPLQATGIKAVYDLTGLQVAGGGILGDQQRSEGVVRWYLAMRVGGQPGGSASAVKLVHVRQLQGVLHPHDRVVADWCSGLPGVPVSALD